MYTSIPRGGTDLALRCRVLIPPTHLTWAQFSPHYYVPVPHISLSLVGAAHFAPTCDDTYLRYWCRALRLQLPLPLTYSSGHHCQDHISIPHTVQPMSRPRGSTLRTSLTRVEVSCQHRGRGWAPVSCSNHVPTSTPIVDIARLVFV